MKKKEQGRRAISKIALPVLAVFLLAVTFHACQKDEMILEPEETGLKEGLISGISLIYPTVDVTVGADFNITFSASCGRIMIERGFILEVDVETGLTNKVYSGLSCDMVNLLWEAVGDDVYATCQGETITENQAEPGTYVYRAKLNFKGKKNIGCPDCDFAGNQYECFMITVVEPSGDTFTDARDGKAYKMLTIGTQTWMAENLAFDIEGSSAYNNDENNVATYGRLYTWDAAMAACPTGWHLPSDEEWTSLMQYVISNYGFNIENYGGVVYSPSVASATGWNYSGMFGTPGGTPANNNSSGFNGMPAGSHTYFGFGGMGEHASWYTSTEYGYGYENLVWSKRMPYNEYGINNVAISTFLRLSVRCIKDAE